MNVERKSISVLRQLTAVVCLFAVLVLWPIRSAQAGLMHNASTTPESAYLEFAELYPSVGWMSSSIGGTEAGFSSGVLIAPNWVITSGHGVLEVDSDPTSFRDTYEVGFGSNFFSDPGESQFADEVFLNPRYGGVESGADIALLYFEDPFTSITPANLFTGTDVVGSTYDFVGYGVPGTPQTGLQTADRERRAGQMTTTSINSPSTGYLRSRFDQPGFPLFLELGIQGTRGDSGGGWFIDGMLAAITSDAGTARYGGDTTGFRLSLELDWISETQASRTEVPEPATAAMLLMGAPFLSRYRKRRSS